MLTSMKSIRDWLHHVQMHQNDTRWLSRQENELHTAITNSVYRAPEFHDAVEVLLKVFNQYAFVLFHVKRWSPLLLKALIQAQDLRDNEMQIRILTFMGESYLNNDKMDAAREAFRIALQRAQDGNSKEMMLASMIGLIRMQSITVGDEYDAGLLTQALALSREIDDLSLIAALHQSLLFAYIYLGKTVAAIEHGQMAYVYWHHLGSKLETAKTLYLLAAAYRFMWRLQRAEDLLQIASEQFGNTDYNRQYAVLAYEAGALYLQRKEYEVAAQWLTLAQKEAIAIDYSQVIAASTHALGLAQTGLEQYTEAAKNLKQAITMWEKLGNFYELANAHQALGNLENKRKQPEQALEWLQKALELCMKTPPSNQRTWLESHIRETIDEIPW